MREVRLRQLLMLLSFFNDDKNALGPGDFFRGRRKCLVDHADLARIDGKLSLEAEGTGVLSVEKEHKGLRPAAYS